MKTKVKATFISLFIITVISIIKLILFYASNSFAVLSEVWHSFSDIGTTLLVLLSLIAADRIKEKKLAETNENLSENKNRFVKLIKKINPETLVSIIISIILIFVSASILWKALFGKYVTVKNPLITGVTFIFLSFASYFIYKFESGLAEKEKSEAIKADAFHNRADMVVSLFTGITLIFYSLGYNFDRITGGITAIFILSFSIEMLINTIIRVKDQTKKNITFSRIIIVLFSAETYTGFINFILKISGTSESASESIKNIFLKIRKIAGVALKVIILSLFLGYLSTSIYTVDTQEEALKLRFGNIVNKDETIKPGIHLKFPWPFESVVWINTKQVFSINIGNINKEKKPRLWSLEHGDSMQFISGDNNFFLPYIIINYKILNPYDCYLLNQNSEKLLQDISLQIFTRHFASSEFYDLAIYKRNELIENSKKEIQQHMNELKSGLEITTISIEDLHPPDNISDSFEKVVAAYQEQQTALNNAEKSKNSMIPKARVNAYTSVNDAKTYSAVKIDKSTGEAESYELRKKPYNENKKIVSKIMELQTAEETLTNKPKVLADPETGISSKMIYIEKFVTGNKGIK